MLALVPARVPKLVEDSKVVEVVVLVVFVIGVVVMVIILVVVVAVVMIDVVVVSIIVINVDTSRSCSGKPVYSCDSAAPYSPA